MTQIAPFDLAARKATASEIRTALEYLVQEALKADLDGLASMIREAVSVAEGDCIAINRLNS